MMSLNEKTNSSRESLKQYKKITEIEIKENIIKKENKIKQENKIKFSSNIEENSKLKKELENVQEMKKFLELNGIKEEFELEEYLASGGESNVFSININYKDKRRKIFKKKAILKSIHSQRYIKEIKNEVLISSKLKNINVIDFYGYLRGKKDAFFIIMEKAKYGNLRNLQRNILKRRTFSESLILFFASQILNGIHYCHKNKIAHMDIKPQNIVIDEFLNIKLIDFSISIDYKNKGPNDEIEMPFIGTNFYMSKEILKGSRIKYKDLSKVDLYALGIVLFNLAFGNYPYELTYGDEDNYDVILEKIEKNELKFPNNDILFYSKHFLDFLKKLLEKDIDKRMSLNEALNHYWIKGAKLLYDEKEKCYNLSSFFSYLITDNIKSFNDYINKKFYEVQTFSEF